MAWRDALCPLARSEPLLKIGRWIAQAGKARDMLERGAYELCT